MRDYRQLTERFESITDFLRFAFSEANAHELYYGHGTDNVKEEVWRLVLGSLKLPFDLEPFFFSARLTIEEKERLHKNIRARIYERIPVPYLTNEAYFCGLPFYVDERVLIPRSPIAELIQQQFQPWIDTDKVERILDLCTGSGCIAIACQYAFPDAEVDAIDLSPEALAVAAINCQRLEVPHINLLESDCWSGVPAHRYDIIVSNPPYVSDEEMTTLPVEYQHEPSNALRADRNGLAIIDEILARATDFLSDEGILIVEVGNSEEAVVEAYPHLPFTWLEFEFGGQGVFLLTASQLKEQQ